MYLLIDNKAKQKNKTKQKTKRINIKVLLIHISKIFKQILATKYRVRFEQKKDINNRSPLLY